MLASVGGILLGLLVGLRHAFEPDHLTAISTLVSEGGGARRGAVLGAIWGVGHTVSLLVVGVILLVIGAVLPARVAAGFEGAVAMMLVGLGVRAIVRALREGRRGPVTTHHHGGLTHTHAGPAHIHVGPRVLAWRPLVIGLVHGLAGSGALTALVFARLPSTAARITYITVFGAGSVAGMMIASGLAGATLDAVARRPQTRRGLAVATGVLSIVVGVVWSVPTIAALT
ncbi:MAG TPA: hypothetical protein VHE35_15530 [Kofleriaceae bacterium]|nr:hypothetical protein [Kofleriaceae bacterium]